MEKLQKSFKNLLAVEEEAKEIYSEILQYVRGKEITAEISSIRNQEINHVRYARELVEIGKKAERRKTRPRISKKVIDTLESDIKFKKDLLPMIFQLLKSENKTFTLFNLLGKKSIEFKKADKECQDLINTVAHQLKTPLSITKWTSELILGERKGKLTDGQKEMVERVKTTNESMLFLVRDLLEMGRIGEEKGKMRVEMINLVKIMQDIIKELDYLAGAKKQKIILRPFKKNVALFGNGDAFKEIISNLLTNAIHYGRNGGEILIKITKQKAGKILISVSDDGIGIPKEEQKNIFKKFFRASNSNQTHHRGTGLGLYMVKELVKRTNGKIWFESEKNKGTTFYVELPVKLKSKKGSKSFV